jgi:hypothetical protein
MITAALSMVVPAACADDSWEFRLTPYLWFAGLEGDAATIPGLPTAPIDLSPSEALEDTETALMLMFDARKRGHGFYLDLLYTDVRSDADPVPALDLTVNSVTKSTIFTAAYEHELLDGERGGLEVLAGARYWSVDSSLSFSGPLGLAGRNEETWVDPFVGLKGRTMLGGSRWYLSGGAGVGGFSVGSKLFWELNANLGWQWTERFGTAIGYRLFEVDHDDDGFVFDVRQAGYQLGLTWSW